jgi:hypothetical protein
MYISSKQHHENDAIWDQRHFEQESSNDTSCASPKAAADSENDDERARSHARIPLTISIR